jgi:hypothetical protein
MIEAEQKADLLCRSVNEIGIQHSLTSAVRLHDSRSSALAEKLRQGADVDGELMSDRLGIEEHNGQVLEARRRVISEVGRNHIDRVYPVIIRLRNAAREMLQELVPAEQKAAEENEIPFSLSKKLAVLLYFGASDAHYSGWSSPFSNFLLAGLTEFPPSDDLYGVGFKFWEPLPDDRLDKAARERAQKEIDFHAELKLQRARDQATREPLNSQMSEAEREEWNRKRDELDARIAGW